MAEYYPLDEKTVITYIQNQEKLSSKFLADDTLYAEEIGDGNLNLVFKVRAKQDPSRTIIVKQALPYARIVGDSWPLPTDRARIEAQALAVQDRLSPDHTPKVYYFDPVMFLIGMENLDDHIILRKGLIEGIQYPHLAQHVGEFLGKTLANMSDLVLAYDAKKAEVTRFINPEMCKITEDLVFTEPFQYTERNAFHDELKPQVEALQADEALRVEVAKMKEKFMTQAQTLIHGDLHTGSIMVNQNETYVIDPEFAFYAPMSFDIGAFIGNMLLSYASHEVRTSDPNQRREYRDYLKTVVIDTWHVFAKEFQTVWDKTSSTAYPPAYRDDYMRRVLQDSAGMGACKMMRRIIGLAGVEDIRGIEDVTQRSVAASLALNMGQKMLMERETFTTIEQLVATVTACQPSYPFVANE